MREQQLSSAQRSSSVSAIRIVFASFIATAVFIAGVVLFIAAVVPHPLRPNPYVAAALVLGGVMLLATVIVGARTTKSM